MLHSCPPNRSRARAKAKWFAAALLLVAAAASSAVADEADDQYAVASGHYSEGNWKFAAEEYLTFLARFPRHRAANDARFFLGESFVQLGRFDEATERFKAYLKNAPQGRFAKQALFRAGESAYFAGTGDVAGHELTLFRAEYPDDALNQYVLTYLGEIAAAEDKTDEASLHFRECLKRFPDGRLHDDCLLGLARILERRGESAEAIRILRALAEKPNSTVAAAARYRLGALHYSLKEYEPAAEAFQMLLRESPGDPKAADARLAYGWSLFKLGRFDEAITAFDALSVDPRLRTDAGYWKGVAQKNARRWSAAAKTLRQTAAEAGDHSLLPEIRFHAADAALRAGEIDEARRQFEAVVNSDAPGAASWKEDARLGLIQIALAEDRLDDVLEQTKTLLASAAEPGLTERATIVRAKALIMASRYEEAATLLRSIPVSDESRFLQATAYARLDRADEAQSLFGAVAEAGGTLALDATLAEAESLTALKRHDEAIQRLTRSLARDDLEASERVKLEFALAVAHAAAGNLDQARKMHADWAQARPVPKGLADVTEKLAEITYASAAYEEALAYFSWLAQESGDPEYREKGLLGKGWAEYELGRTDDAGRTFGWVVDDGRDPSRGAEAALARGRLLAMNKKEDAALAMFDLIVRRYSDTPFVSDALLESGRLLARKQQFDQAERRFASLLEKYPDHPAAGTACYERAWVLHDLGRKAEAFAAFKRVHDKYPEAKVWADATYRLAKAALDGGDVETAERLTEEVLSKMPDSPSAADALSLQWRLAATRGDWAAVDAAAARLLKEFPKSRLATAAAFWRAEAAFRAEDPNAAKEQFDTLWETHRGNQEDWVAAVQLRRAQLAAGAKDWENARRIAVETKKQYPEFPQDYEFDYVIGRCLAAEGKFTDAREAYNRVIASKTGGKTETAAMAQWMIGESFFHQEDYEAAAKAYYRVDTLHAYPRWQALALLQAGKCHEKLQQPQKAAERYRKLLERFPEDEYAKSARVRLERLE